MPPDAVLLHRGGMVRIVADREQPAMNFRMQRLHAPVHHLGKARQVRHVLHRQRRLLDRLRRAAGRNEFDARLVQRAGEIGKARLVGDGNEGAADALDVGGVSGGLSGIPLGRASGGRREWSVFRESGTRFPGSKTRHNRESGQ